MHLSLSATINSKLLFIILICLHSQAYAQQETPAEQSEWAQAEVLEPNIARGKEIYKRCAHCHTESGDGMVDGISRRFINGYYPRLAGQHRNVLIKQLADIRAGNRDNPSMYPFTLNRNLNGAQGIADVTAYIATLPVNTPNNVGPGIDLEHGKKLYEDNCVKCHGANGEGHNQEYQPRLQGQHYAYMLRQMVWIRDGKRRNANDKMVSQIHRFNHRDLRAVVDYASRLKPAEVKK